WQKIDDFIDSESRELIEKGYLLAHKSEKGSPNAVASFTSRKERTVYSNILEPHLAYHIGNLSQEINFGDLADPLKDIIDDATGYGCSAKELHQLKMEMFCKYGKYGVLVDAPPKVTGDRAEDRTEGLRAYQELFSARQIKDWSFFGKGPNLG